MIPWLVFLTSRGGEWGSLTISLKLPQDLNLHLLELKSNEVVFCCCFFFFFFGKGDFALMQRPRNNLTMENYLKERKYQPLPQDLVAKGRSGGCQREQWNKPTPGNTNQALCFFSDTWKQCPVWSGKGIRPALISVQKLAVRKKRSSPECLNPAFSQTCT